MKPLLEVFFEVKYVKEMSYGWDFDCWSVTPDNQILLLRERKLPDNLIGHDEKGWTFRRLDLEETGEDYPCAEYSKLLPYMETMIEFKTDIPKFYQKYPLVCVRGICAGGTNCNREKDGQSFYCFHNVPCTKGRPDWNCWTGKYPDTLSLILDIMDWIARCKTVNAFVVMFQNTPTIWNPDLDFTSAIGIEIKNQTLTVGSNPQDVSAKYREYNSKYPTQDLEILRTINDKDDFFRF